MTIKLLARELYAIIREVEAVERELADAPADRKDVVANRLRKLKAERDRIRRALDGGKDVPARAGTAPYRRH